MLKSRAINVCIKHRGTTVYKLSGILTTSTKYILTLLILTI